MLLARIDCESEDRRVTERARRASGGTRAAGEDGSRPDPEVSDKAKRRRFTAKYKLEILREADRCTKSGELGALLRREGIYSSNLSAWRRARERGELAGLRPNKRGRKAKTKDARDKQLAEQQREIRRLKHKLAQAETVIEIQKKASELLGISLNSPDDEEND